MKENARLLQLYYQAKTANDNFLAHTTPANKQRLLDALRTMRAEIDFLEYCTLQVTPTEAEDTGEMEAVR